MIDLSPASNAVAPSAEFDPYVPVTVHWPRYTTLLQAPTYVRCVEEHRLMELKFDPESHELVALVLVNAPHLTVVPRTFGPTVETADVVARWTGDDLGGEYERLTVEAWQDCVVMDFTRSRIERWTGNGPVFFGVGPDGTVGAIGVRWAAPYPVPESADD